MPNSLLQSKYAFVFKNSVEILFLQRPLLKFSFTKDLCRIFYYKVSTFLYSRSLLKFSFTKISVEIVFYKRSVPNSLLQSKYVFVFKISVEILFYKDLCRILYYKVSTFLYWRSLLKFSFTKISVEILFYKRPLPNSLLQSNYVFVFKISVEILFYKDLCRILLL